MKDYAGIHKQALLNRCHEAVEKDLRSDTKLFFGTNYRRLLRGNIRMVLTSFVKLYRK